MTELANLSAVELLALYRKKALSPVEYFDWLERHIDTWETELKALYLYRPDAGRAEAKASEARYAKGAPSGPLDGVPVTVKEIIATKGDPIPLGSAATKLVPATEDAPTAARLREDGAIIFAKTTCPDYGMLSSGISSFHPTTRNPWDLTKNPGGSSSGAGAAGAAGYGPLHLGTDIGGSIRLPAGWCALFGLKPSQGRVPVEPFYLGRVAGPMTRTVDDAVLMMESITRPDWRDGMSLPPEAIAWSDLAIDMKGLRVGLMLDAGCGLPVQDEVHDAVLAAAKQFERAGATVAEVEPVMTQAMLDGVDTFFRARSWSDIETYDPEARARILPVHPHMGGERRKAFGRRGDPGLQPDQRDAQSRGAAVCERRPRAIADIAGRHVSGRMGLADQRPAAPVRAHLLHRAVEHGREPRRLDQLRLQQGRPRDRPANRRPAVR